MIQVLNKMASFEDRPSMIYRYGRAEIESLGVVLAGFEGEEIEELTFYLTPLPSCQSPIEKKWLIQVYLRTEHIELTGFPWGRKKYESRVSDMFSQPYGINENLPFFLVPSNEVTQDNSPTTQNLE